ncbi:MAG: HEAT repeat domain-containing protein [Zavarzinella sp.]
MRRWLMRLFAVTICGASGCASTIDFVTGERFLSNPVEAVFTPAEEPMWVLENAPEGDRREKAFRDLEEPIHNGGDAAQQAKAVQWVRTGATTDRRALVRLAAIEAAANFKDPQAADILVDAYRNAAFNAPPTTGSADVQPVAGLEKANEVASFTPDTITTIRCRSLAGLGKIQSPKARELLIEVAKQQQTNINPQQNLDSLSLARFNATVGTNETDHQTVRLAAIRSLGEYRNDPAAMQALVEIMESERDVALRSRAHESLEMMSGQSFPADPKPWKEWLNSKQGTR